MFFPCPRLRLRIKSHETGVRPSRPESTRRPFFTTLRLNLVLTHGVSPDFCDDSVHIYLIYNVQPPYIGSVPSIRSRNCVPMTFIAERPPAQTEVVLKVVPVTGACVLFRFHRHHGSNVMMRLSFPTPTNNIIGVYDDIVDMTYIVFICAIQKKSKVFEKKSELYGVQDIAGSGPGC